MSADGKGDDVGKGKDVEIEALRLVARSLMGIAYQASTGRDHTLDADHGMAVFNAQVDAMLKRAKKRLEHGPAAYINQPVWDQDERE